MSSDVTLGRKGINEMDRVQIMEAYCYYAILRAHFCAVMTSSYFGLLATLLILEFGFKRGSIVNCIACRYAIDDGVFHNKNTRPQESKLSYSREITRWNIFVKRGNVTCRGERQLRGLETIAVDDVKF
ncbi:predicted protein [Histoplasma capsulatum H143]|uniref:Uncharacterized protein n=1 Tax=Ajellomyces capsulatus (strain H143) TaxID=544712 RepID=C6HKY4_AJECH|nr:predicted protein [Histoplasma capsulatum H143]